MDLSGLYLVAGRVDGQDDETVLVVASDEGLGKAKQIFRHRLLAQVAQDEGADAADYCRDNGMVYLSIARPLSVVAENAITSPGIEALSGFASEDDAEILPGW